MSEIEQARSFALDMHHDQRWGNYPYIEHLDRVAARIGEVATRGASAKSMLIVTGYLHDVIEDTDATYADITGRFGYNVADLVASVTDEPGRNRRARKLFTYSKIRNAGPNAILVKLADRIVNMQECAQSHPELLRVYLKEAYTFKAALWDPAHIELATLWDEHDRIAGLESLSVLSAA